MEVDNEDYFTLISKKKKFFYRKPEILFNIICYFI